MKASYCTTRFVLLNSHKNDTNLPRTTRRQRGIVIIISHKYLFSYLVEMLHGNIFAQSTWPKPNEVAFSPSMIGHTLFGPATSFDDSQLSPRLHKTKQKKKIIRIMSKHISTSHTSKRAATFSDCCPAFANTSMSCTANSADIYHHPGQSFEPPQLTSEHAW